MTALLASSDVATHLSRLDFNRLAAQRQRAGTEWTHFSVTGRDVSLVVNLSVTRKPERTVFQLTTLLYAGGVWAHVRSFSANECSMPAGGTTQRFGDSCVELRDDGYVITLREPALRLSADLTARAVCLPSFAPNMSLGHGRTLNWLVVPSLSVDGTIASEDREWTLSGAPGYRDRNWGADVFASEASWDWGYAVSLEGQGQRALVIARLMDRRRACCMQQNLFVWEQGRIVALFRDHAIHVRERGRARLSPIVNVPAVLAIGKTGEASGLPETFELAANSADAALGLTFRPESAARVFVPRSQAPGSVRIVEALGQYEVSGTIGGTPFRLSERGFLERLHG